MCFIHCEMASVAASKLLLLENSLLSLKILKKLKKKRGRQETSEIYKDRLTFGEFHHLYPQLRADEIKFYQYTRMQINTFDYISENIYVLCYHITTNFQRPISVEERLFLMLRYLSTGISFRQIAFTFRISKSSVAFIVKEVCQAIWEALQKMHMPVPTIEHFETVSKDYFQKWNFPNCLGSIDGKHIRLKCPANSGSMYFNYKSYFSIVLLAIVDANYRFLMVDVGAYGKDSDAGVFANSAIFENINNGNLALPSDKPLPESELQAPFVFVGDEAFPLRTYLMRPFPARRLQNNTTASDFNYRLSRARMTVECAFGISSAKFRILLKAIETNVPNAVVIVKAICIIHNIIIDMEKEESFHNIFEHNSSSTAAINLKVSRTNNHAPREAEIIRNTFCDYFSINKI